ncbi:MAG TPA: hypothetical protein VJJ73_00385 [Candidatus Paceibacterota bacterium]
MVGVFLGLGVGFGFAADPLPDGVAILSEDELSPIVCLPACARSRAVLMGPMDRSWAIFCSTSFPFLAAATADSRSV